jgi:hypothetical protein
MRPRAGLSPHVSELKSVTEGFHCCEEGNLTAIQAGLSKDPCPE